MTIKLVIDVAITGLIMGGLYALIAMGLNLQYGVARVLNVSHGEFVMVGAFITYFARNQRSCSVSPGPFHL
jgi:branched-chain amino acid transport system permease protein